MSNEEVPSTVLLWKITNFSIWNKLIQDNLYSPCFVLNHENESLFQWYLEIQRDTLKKEIFGVYLSRKAKQLKHVSKAVSLTYKFRLFKNNDCIENKEQLTYVFKKDIGFGYPQLFDSNKINSSNNSIFDKDSIVILCEIMNKNVTDKGSDILLTRLTSFTPVSENVSFKWLIKDALNLNIDNRKTFPVGCFLTVDLSFITVNNKKVVKAVISGTVENDCSWMCFITFSKNDEEFLFEKGLIKSANLPQEIILKTCLTYQNIYENKEKYLTNESLLLNCNFSILETEVMQSTSIRNDIVSNQADLHKIINDLKDNFELPLYKDMKRLHLEKTLSDFTLDVESKVFTVHSALLIARSEVFSQMLQTNMKEKIERKLTIDDMDESTVSGMLEYIYTDKPGNMNVERALKLYYAGDKYRIDGLVEKCSDFLVENLTTSNVSDVLELADKHSDKKLRSVVLEYILQHEKEILLSQKFKEFLKNNSSLAALVLLGIAELKYCSASNDTVKSGENVAKDEEIDKKSSENVGAEDERAKLCP